MGYKWVNDGRIIYRKVDSYRGVYKDCGAHIYCRLESKDSVGARNLQCIV